jgi:hypothetical protein
VGRGLLERGRLLEDSGKVDLGEIGEIEIFN